MARMKGSANFSGTIEPLAGGSLDARDIVQTKADLTASNSFPYSYIGMETYVVAENKKYRLIGADPTILNNWEEVGGGGSISVDDEIDNTSENPVQNKVIAGALDGKADLIAGKIPSSQLPSYVDDVIEGYYKESDGKFYEEDTYETEIAGEPSKIYISLDTNKSYRWSGSMFVEIASGNTCNETINLDDFNDLPTSEKNNGTAYYIPDANIVTNFTVMGNRFDRGNIYTADERMIGSWMGKPLYQKTFTVNNINITNSWLKIVENAIPDYETIVCSKTSTLSSGDQYYCEAQLRASINSNGDLSVCNITTGTLNAVSVICTVQYTKTTDVHINIGTNNDYTTDEQIIGTWINGKKLYQKTIVCGTLPNNNTKYVDHNIENLDCVVSISGSAQRTNDNLRIALPHISVGALANGISIAINDTKVSLQTGANLTSYTTSYITLQYTKTED